MVRLDFFGDLWYNEGINGWVLGLSNFARTEMEKRHRRRGKMKLVLIVLVMNIVTAGVARMIFGRKLEITGETEWSDEIGVKPTVFLIAGMMNQATEAFKFSKFEGYEICYLNFSKFGFSPRQAGRQIGEEWYSEGDVVLGISIGAKAAVFSGRTKQILINPCVFPETLKPRLRTMVKIFAPLIELASYTLGWLAILAVIPADAGKYSLALVADQLFAIAYGKPSRRMATDGNAVGVILSTEDESLDNMEIERTFFNSGTMWIPTKHGRTTEAESKEYYRQAVERFLYLPRD